MFVFCFLYHALILADEFVGYVRQKYTQVIILSFRHTNALMQSTLLFLTVLRMRLVYAPEKNCDCIKKTHAKKKTVSPKFLITFHQFFFHLYLLLFRNFAHLQNFVIVQNNSIMFRMNKDNYLLFTNAGLIYGIIKISNILIAGRFLKLT